MTRHVIVGRGAVGSTTAQLLAERGHEVRVVSRSGGSSGTAQGTGSVEYIAADAADAAALSDIAQGAVALYNCANPAYHRWPVDWPPLANALLEAAEATGSVLVTTSNLYVYGPVAGPMTEDLPLATSGTKGRVRAQMWRDAKARHHSGRIRATEARASDYFGPLVTDQSHIGARVLEPIGHGKTVRVVGDPDQPHSWTYVPDVARALVRLGADERAWGRVWHVPTNPPRSQREMVTRMCEIAGVEPVPVRGIPKIAVRGVGLFSKTTRELNETWYQFDRPFVLDSSAYTNTFGESATPMDEALSSTLDWWRSRPAS
ncbi:MAG: NAD-dependent epimerase/dehydratase family protein [Candidatus Nanopelagicales bacterium]